MIRRLAAIFTVVAVFTAVSGMFPAFAAEGSVYVSPAGDDRWSGRAAAPAPDGKDGPFATLRRAVEAARAAGIKSIVVRGGHYRLDQTLVLAAEDEGLRIAAAPGERPVLSGGERVEGFKPEADGILAAPLAKEPGLDVTFAGRRLQAARSGDFTPDDPIRSGWFVATAVKGGGDKRRFRFTPGVVNPKWAQPGVRVQALDRERLADDIAGIEKVDAARHTLTLDADAWYPLRDGATFRLLGHPDFLRHPGQFAWRAKDKRLLLLPPDAEAFARDPSVLVARVSPLVRLAGTFGVTLDGLGFEDVPYTGPAVRVEGGGRHRILNGRFANVGTALELAATSDNEVRGNRMENLGRNGVDVKPGSTGNQIVANAMHGIGEVSFFSAGVFLAGTKDTVVGHNDIRRSARYGVSVKNWSPETVNTGTIVEYNRIRDTARETADAGGIETLGRSDVDTGIVIRYNDVRETGGIATDAAGRWLERYKGFGIYLDDLTNGVLVEGNFLMDTGWAAVFIHGGDRNRVENNIAVLTHHNNRFLRLEWVPKAGVAGFLRENSITQNIIHLRASVRDIVESHTGGQPVLNANVIDRPGSAAAAFRAPVSARTHQGPRLANPYFVDPAADDFRLRPDGLARELGIEDLPWSRIGPAGYPGR